MTIVPIYDELGTQLSEIKIDDDLQPVNGRVSKGRNSYYKGAGVKYEAHSVYEADVPKRKYRVHSSPQPYIWIVSDPNFLGKSGIFQTRYQPYFTDFIGTCGKKERQLLTKAKDFELSSVKVLDFVEYDYVHQQGYYQLEYACGRTKYLSDSADPSELMYLLEYMIHDKWCFAWDKNAIADISHNGLVCDPADVFKSESIGDIFGSVYAIINSLWTNDPTNERKYFMQFLYHNNLTFSAPHNVALEVLARHGVDTTALTPYDNNIKNIAHINLNYLTSKNNYVSCVCALPGSSREFGDVLMRAKHATELEYWKAIDANIPIDVAAQTI